MTAPTTALVATHLDVTADNLQKIDHLVVLMMENRAFDHMLGYLKLDHGLPVDGLTAGMANAYLGTSYAVHPLTSTAFKDGQDPCHDGACVAEQLSGNNGGFVANYARTHSGDPERDLVMGYYRKDDVPVYHEMALSYCVCDRWFSSVDGATWPNRLYSIAGRSAGSKNNRTVPIYSLPSFVRHLDGRGVTWNWYVHASPPTLRLIDPDYRIGRLDRFRWFDHPTGTTFLRDAAAGKLPAVSWIDPDFSDLGFTGNDDHPPSDINKGQELVLKVLHAVQTSPQWKRTLLVVVYDEHGGLFDHVVPPGAADDDKNFRRHGVRVPAFAVSPWVDTAAVSSTVFDHTSIIKTILLRFCQDQAGKIPDMGKRVTAANHLGGLLTRPTPTLPTDVTPLIARMAAWKAAAFHASFAPAAEARSPAGIRNDLQRGLARAREVLKEEGLPEGAL